jgi:mono/diheme cytochrome c family protein/predicted Ser/Thr protein kinase
MLRWEEARRQGRELSPEEICAECPQFADELRRRLRTIVVMERLLGRPEREPARTGPAPAGAAEAAESERLPLIPGYEILRVIDRGGMGVVYEARQVDLGRKVAIKMISGAHLSPRVVTRFRLEAEAAAMLQHPNFVQIFEVGQVNGRPFLAMEYVAGGSLADLLGRQPLSARRAAEVMETLARAASAAHERGIVHRDLKPSNVMLAADGTPKIADFGLAKRLDVAVNHTHTGEILGTPSYMAPEQAEGRKDLIGPATDVYALGTILYELLTGRPPFCGTSLMESLRLVIAEEPIAPSRLAPAVPRDLEAICLKCLEKAPARRYASALALAEDLRRFLNGQPVAARHLGPVGRTWKWMRRHPQAVALCATLGLLAIVPVVLVLEHYRAEWERRAKEQEAERKVRARAEEVAPAVREILQRNCYQCHGGDPQNVRKKLNILDYQDLLDSTRRVVVPGSPDDSRLIQRIADGSMPPEEEETRLPRLSENELVILQDWIVGGAPPFPEDDAEPADAAVVPRSESAAKVKAIFQERCYKCHRYDVAKGGIKILHHRLLVSVRKVVVPGQPEDSELYQLLTTKDSKARMPPSPNRRLSPQEIAIIRDWILEGAPPFPKSE